MSTDGDMRKSQNYNWVGNLNTSTSHQLSGLRKHHEMNSCKEDKISSSQTRMATWKKRQNEYLKIEVGW